MKRKDKDNAEYIRSKLQPINEKITLPDELSAKNIASLVSGKEQKKSKKGKIIALRTISSVAAAIILAFGIGAAINHFNKPAINKMPDEIEQAVTPLSNNTKQTIIDYFTVLKAEYEESNRFVLFEEIVYNSASKDSAAMPESGVMADDGIATDMNTSATGTNSSSHGTTNVQVQGIDEDDIIKNDGKYIYVLSDSSVKIIDAANMKLMSKTDFESRGSNGMYIYKNTLAVVGHDYTENNQTVIEIYDITDKAKPRLVNEFSQDGGYFSSRLIGGKVILLSQFYVYPEDINLTKGYAVYDDIAPGVTVNGVCERISPDMITILPQQKNYSETYTVMTTVDLDSSEFKPVTSAVLGTGENVYCTTENLYVCDTVYNRTETVAGDMVSVTDLGPMTKIHRFSIKDGTIRSEATGEVKGRMLNQFSIDEKGEYIRVATTTGTANSVYVLDKSLKEVSKITDIAKGETIQSVRYIGDYGYVVTFRQTDPLFVIDFKDMKKPKIVGELKIPGFSSYLHPFNGYLVGIGTDGDDNGTTDALKISLFDISDPTKPQEIDRFIVPHAYAETGHKTVMDCSEKDILGFIYYDNRTGDSQLATLRIKEGKIEHIGSYTNRKAGEGESGTVYTPDGGEEIIMYDKTMYSTFAIRRATYIGDTLYTVSEHRICSYPLEGGKVIATLDF
ncbi:MAG: beta-propeller domain-containing protein [Clostridia bacterium]|nr:beta-propeller domain-containing protein [Clostridia bacterium]